LIESGTEPAEVVASVLARIEAVDPAVGAFTYVDADASRGDSASAESPLAGAPFGIKELFEVAGWPHTAGSLAWEGRIGTADSEAVRRLKSAGAIPIGLTRTHEFAMGVTTQHEGRGSTRNPWKLDRVPGGSSGGSGAAVAAGMVPFALGSDTSGSVRIPAVLCGIVGFRPTHGVIPLDGVVPLAPSFDTVGVLAREVADLLLVFDVVSAGSIRAEARPDLSGLTIGLPQSFDPPIGPAQTDAISIAAEAATGLGATIVPVSLPGFAEVDKAVDFQRAEMIDVHTRVLRTWPAQAELLGASLRSRLGPLVERGADVEGGRQAMEAVRRAVGELDVDLVLSPVAAQGASAVSDPEGGGFRDSTLRCNHLQSVAGAPSIAFPVGLDPEGLPVGVQMWGKPGADPLVLGAGGAVRDAVRSRLPDWPPDFQ
jgi:aspartyl-tRNA(Asn)/glutamyl-tRNA(Gln) amidotransferase subunit A